MRSLFFALVGSAAVCSSSVLFAAPDKNPPPLAVPTLTISGQVAFNTWFFHNNVVYQSGRAGDDPTARKAYAGVPLFSMDDGRLRFTVEGKTDPGMKYGLIFVLDADTSASKTLRESYIFGEGTWGKAFLGNTYGVQSTMAFGGYDQWGATKFMEGNPDRVVNYTVGTFHSVNLVGDTNRATKVTYMSPRWKGLQLGVTYTPRSEHKGEQSPSAVTSLSSPQVPFDINNIASGINFIHKFVNELQIALSATSIFSGVRPEFQGAPARKSVASFALGTTFTYYNWGLSAEYGNNGKSKEFAGQNLSNAGQFIDFGLAYMWGPTKLSAGYYYAWRNSLGGGVTNNFTKGKAITNAVAAAMDHKFAPGMIVYLEYMNIQMKNSAAAAEAARVNAYGSSTAYVGPVPNNRNSTFVLGSRLVF